MSEAGHQPANLLLRSWRYAVYCREHFLQDPDYNAFLRWRQAKAEAAAKRYFGKTDRRRRVLDRISGSMSTGVSLADYHILHAYVLQRKPRRALEFGSGRSTAVIAAAFCELAERCGDGAAGHLVSLEDIPEYHRHAIELCPTDLKPFVTYVHADKVEGIWRDQIWGFHYGTQPAGPFDLVFVDGPTESKNGRKGACLDLLYYLAAHPSEKIDVLVDRKISSLKAYQAVLPPRSVTFDPVMDLGVIAGVSGGDIGPYDGADSWLPTASAWRRLGLSSNPNL